MTKVTTIFDGTIISLRFLAGIILLFILASVTAEIFSRYLLNKSIIWVLEITEILLLFIPLLGATWLLKHGRHVKMDIVTSQLKPKAQLIINIITSIVSAIVCWIFVWYGVQVTYDHFQRGLFEETVLEIPTAAILWIIPVGFFFLGIQFLRGTYGYLKGRKTSESTPGTKSIDEAAT